MIRTRLFVIFIAQIFGFHCAVGIDLSKVDLSYQYDLNTELQFAHRVVDNGDSLNVFYSVSRDSVNEWKQVMLLQESYTSVKHDTLRAVNLDTIGREGQTVYYKLSIRKPDKAVLLIEWYDLNRGEFLIEDIRVKSPVGFPSYYPVDKQGLPLLINYVTTGSIRMNDGRFHAFAYADNFGPADPAMGRMKAIAPNLSIDSSFYFDEQVSGLSLYTFYLIQDDTLNQSAITLLNCPEYYPKMRRVEELVPPLTYISTESEIKTLSNKMTKSAFEIFWVNTYGSRFRAKAAIRKFYKNIETVNHLFTDYKQGWKTDRGVIYLIFGKPDRVYRSESAETWQYITGVEFEFIRISTLFTPSMYTLRRDRSYEQTWYNRVGQLRKGM